MTFDPVRLGVIGMGRAFVLMLSAFRADDRIKLVAACDPNAQSREAFEQEFKGRAYASVAELCADSDVEAIYIASPHQFHTEHALAGARAGKHALVEKPVAVSLDDARRMVAAFEKANLQLIVGPSHSFDAPVVKARSIIESGELGRVKMLHALNCTDFLYRPRRPEELRTADGGGVVFSQGVHQIDMVRLLCGQKATQVTAMTGNWDPKRATEGAYAALLAFEGGIFATLTYSGYGHFDSDEWQDDINELGYPKAANEYGRARRVLADITSAKQEAALKQTRTFGMGDDPKTAPYSEHFGPLIVFCEHGDLRLTPKGVHIFTNTDHKFIPCPIKFPRADIIDALYTAVRDNRPPAQTGHWGLASLEICHAILKSAKTSKPVRLQHQIGL